MKQKPCPIAEVLRKIIEDESNDEVDLDPAKLAFVNMIKKKSSGKPQVLGMKLKLAPRLKKGYKRITIVRKIK